MPTEEQEHENLLRWLTDVYLQIQKLRISMGNRVWAAENETDATNSTATVFRQNLFEMMENAEKVVSK